MAALNVISTEKRQEVIRLLIEGWSIRAIKQKVGVDKNTALRYMHLIGMTRRRGHRSPMAYRHRNQCKEWWQQHQTPPAEYDEAAALELQWMALSSQYEGYNTSQPKLPDGGWKEGYADLRKIRHYLRTKRGLKA